MEFDPEQITRTQLLDAPESPFVVIRVQRNYNVAQGPIVHHDQYFLRSGASVKDAARAALAEFHGLGFFDSVLGIYASGVVHKTTDEYVIAPDVIRGFNFWAAEGLVGKLFEESLSFPKIRNNVPLDKKLYTFGLGIDDASISDKDIAKLLVDPEIPCMIELAPTYVKQDSVWQLYRAYPKAADSVMNYGRIWNENSTFFLDNDSGLWYSLLNREITVEQKRYCEIMKKTPPKSHAVVSHKGYHFRESDKVSLSSHFFFNGSMLDLFEILGNNGVDVSEVLGK